jgi:hypothetical protein
VLYLLANIVTDIYHLFLLSSIYLKIFQAQKV